MPFGNEPVRLTWEMMELKNALHGRQCLSATSLFGSKFMSDYKTFGQENWSPMPFGNEPVRLKKQRLDHNELQVWSPMPFGNEPVRLNVNTKV